MVTLKYIHCLFHVGASCLLAPQLIYSSQERSGGSCVHLTMPKVQAVLERGGFSPDGGWSSLSTTVSEQNC